MKATIIMFTWKTINIKIKYEKNRFAGSFSTGEIYVKTVRNFELKKAIESKDMLFDMISRISVTLKSKKKA